MSAELRAAVAAAAGEGAPDTIALTRVLAEAATEAEARAALQAEAEARERAGDRAGLHRLHRLLALWAGEPQAWGVVRRTLAGMDHGAGWTDAEDALRHVSAAFDRLATASPEASVALYSLGSPALLAAATAEVVGFMDALGLLAPTRDGLDLGCGIGRFCLALSPRLRSVTGLDIAPAMVAEARRRCAGLSNVEVLEGSGRDLGGLPDAGFDLVLAADVFPYLVQAGGGLPARHLAEFARVLRPGGAALVLNWSYRGNRDADRREAAALAAGAGLRVERAGGGGFTTWDGDPVLLRRP